MVKKLIAILIITGSLNAFTIIEILGGQKVGTTSMTFLKIGVGAKQEAMGGAGVSIVHDATCLYWNPGAAPFIPSGRSIAFQANRWLAGIYHGYTGYVMNFRKYNTVGIHLIGLHSDYIEKTDEYHPFGTGTYFYSGDFLLGLTYARKLIDRFAFGLTAKYIHETLDTLTMSGFAIDIGTLYFVGYKNIKIGVSLSNIGPDVRPSGTYIQDGVEKHYESFSLPVMYRFGVSGNIIKPLGLSFEIDKPTDNVEVFRIGGEYVIENMISIRAGYKLNSNLPGEQFPPSGISFGIGVAKSLGFRKELHIDYSFSSMGYAGDVHKLSMGVNF
ncbi:MAG: PorV/PorQ family protein [Candidatus Hydrothermae bacterium]|nr:PorV/PorQ family protein [Candidatus Hydrothermae bacterium]